MFSRPPERISWAKRPGNPRGVGRSKVWSLKRPLYTAAGAGFLLKGKSFPPKDKMTMLFSKGLNSA
jgi:hypothetical protein